jgi:hypothetical protein
MGRQLKRSKSEDLPFNIQSTLREKAEMSLTYSFLIRCELSTEVRVTPIKIY